MVQEHTKKLKSDKTSSRINAFIVLFVIILIQAVLLISFSFHKIGGGVHIDEVYSYVLSNSYDGDRISNIPEYWNQWIKSNDLLDCVTVQSGEQFSYDKTYFNNEKDCHPPLYYFLLHTICSFFPNIFSLWFGLALNIFLFVILAVLIYKTSTLFLGSSYISMVPVIIYGFSYICVDTVLFIRMYMLLSLLTCAMFYISALIIRYGISLRRIISLYVISLLGSGTHYYFIIFAFCLTLVYCIYKFLKKQIKDSLLFGATVLLSIITLLALYPFAISQALGSETNNIGDEVSDSFFSFSYIFLDIKVFLSSIIRLTNKYLCFVMIVFFAVIIVIAFLKKKTKKQKTIVFRHIFSNKFLIFYFLVFLLTVILALHTSGKYANIRYIYNMAPIMSILIVALFGTIINMLDCKKIFSVTLIIVSLINGILLVCNPFCSYIYDDENQYINDIKGNNIEHLILINGESKNSLSPVIPTRDLFRFTYFENIYMTSLSDINNVYNTLEELDVEGITVVVAYQNEWVDGYNTKEIIQNILDNSSKYQKYKYILSDEFSDVYHINK